MRAAAAICLVLLASACGGTSGSSASSTPGGSALQSGAVAFARCMRSHQVPSWPDPSSSGVFDKTKVTLQQLGVSASRLQSAQDACRHLLPNGGRPPNQAQLQQERAQALRYSRCMREHGVAGFPDPTGSGRMRIPDPASVGIDQGSPAFEAANRACTAYRPPYIPSNSAYEAWAKTQG